MSKTFKHKTIDFEICKTPCRLLIQHFRLTGETEVTITVRRNRAKHGALLKFHGLFSVDNTLEGALRSLFVIVASRVPEFAHLVPWPKEAQLTVSDFYGFNLPWPQ